MMMETDHLTLRAGRVSSKAVAYAAIRSQEKVIIVGSSSNSGEWRSNQINPMEEKVVCSNEERAASQEADGSV